MAAFQPNAIFMAQYNLQLYTCIHTHVLAFNRYLLTSESVQELSYCLVGFPGFSIMFLPMSPFS